MIKSKILIKSCRILISPLNWGLGHVARTVPIIHQLLQNKNDVIICCDSEQKEFYKNYFPSVTYAQHEGYPFKFQGKGQWTKDILKNIISLNKFIAEEKKTVENLIRIYQPQLIISDQRFGFISKQVKSIIISHQLNLPTGNLNFIAKKWNTNLLNSFDEIWIPDTPEQKYSGNLSDGIFKNKQFIGICSRFSLNKLPEQQIKKYKYLGIVSGPKPYNKQLFEIILTKFSEITDNCIIISPENFAEKHSMKNIEIITQATHQDFLTAMLESEIIISRSGYSTLMDLAVTKHKAILIPTPGQAEQIYLSKLHNNNPNWIFKTESKFLKM